MGFWPLGVDNVMSAMLEGQISSGAAWPRKMVQEICNLYQVQPLKGSGFLSASLSDGCCEIGPGMAKDRPLIVRSAPLQTVVPVSFSFRSKRHNNHSIIECTSPTAYI